MVILVCKYPGSITIPVPQNQSNSESKRRGIERTYKKEEIYTVTQSADRVMRFPVNPTRFYFSYTQGTMLNSSCY